jgi:hypothetical protein
MAALPVPAGDIEPVLAVGDVGAGDDTLAEGSQSPFSDGRRVVAPDWSLMPSSQPVGGVRNG